MNVPENPVVPGDFLHQVKLDVLRIFLFRDSKLPADTADMRIYHYAGLVINISADNIGGFSADSGKGG
jgi:hypothetical protein